jgi:hypothetical protein
VLADFSPLAINETIDSMHSLGIIQSGRHHVETDRCLIDVRLRAHDLLASARPLIVP